MSVLFYYMMMTCYAVHALLDAVCLLVTLLDPYLYNFLLNEADGEYHSPPRGADATDSSSKNPLLSSANAHQQQAEVKSVASREWWKEKCRKVVSRTQPQWEFFLRLYPSLFSEDYARDVCAGHVHKTSCRLFMYWASTMSLVRIMAIYFPITPLFLTLSVVYFFEFLVFQYEGVTLQIFLLPSKSRIMSILAMSMSLFSVLLCIWTF